MNLQNNWLSLLGNAITTVAVVLSISTLELAYLTLAVLGFLISFLSWLDRRISIKAERQASAERLNLDKQRTRAIVDYLNKSDNYDMTQADEVVAKVQRVMEETEIQP